MTTLTLSSSSGSTSALLVTRAECSLPSKESLGTTRVVTGPSMAPDPIAVREAVQQALGRTLTFSVISENPLFTTAILLDSSVPVGVLKLLGGSDPAFIEMFPLEYLKDTIKQEIEPLLLSAPGTAPLLLTLLNDHSQPVGFVTKFIEGPDLVALYNKHVTVGSLVHYQNEVYPLAIELWRELRRHGWLVIDSNPKNFILSEALERRSLYIVDPGAIVRQASLSADTIEDRSQFTLRAFKSQLRLDALPQAG